MLSAFDGWTLDWNAVLGAGFRSVPKGWRSVFRECPVEDLARISREGMKPTPEEARHPELSREMKLLDRCRPARLVRQGISRSAAISGVPALANTGQALGGDRVVLEMKVDPARCYVGDADFLLNFLPFVGTDRETLERYRGLFRQYWKSVIPMEEFRSGYVRVETAGAPHWIAKKGVTAGQPRTFFAPEVLVMVSVIPKRHLRIVRWALSEGGEDTDLWEDPEEVWGES